MGDKIFREHSKFQIPCEIILSMTTGQPQEWEIRTIPQAMTVQPDG